MKITHNKVPSKEAQLVLDALISAVRTELEKKRKLGHYTVTWDGEKPVLKGNDAPSNQD